MHRAPNLARWVVILQPDGVVDSVDGGAPLSWTGASFLAIEGVGRELRHLAAALLEAPTRALVRRGSCSISVKEVEVEVEVLVVDALPLRRTYTPVFELVTRTLDAFVGQAQAIDVELHVVKSDDVPHDVVVDGEKVAWALATLVGNALRFAQNRRGARVDVLVRWHTETHQIEFVVKDNGPGMPTQQARWLFEKNPADGRSAGLALVMVRDVVAAHRGTITVESSPGHGTAFTMRLPILFTDRPLTGG